MKKVLLWTALLLAFAGCNNDDGLGHQIEKCVQARIAVATEHNQQAESRNAAKFGFDWREKAREQPRGPWSEYGPEQVASKAEIEATARMVCLTVAAGSSKK
jgi:hypothetical protein